MIGLYAAVTRQFPDGTPPGGWFPEERITLAQAVEYYTAGSAYAEFADDRKGRLQPGYLADFVVLLETSSTCAARDPRRREPVMTVVGGSSRVRGEAEMKPGSNLPILDASHSMRDLAIVFRTPSEIEADRHPGPARDARHRRRCSVDNSRTAFPLASTTRRGSGGSRCSAEDARTRAAHHREPPRRGRAGARVVPFGSELEPLERRIGYRFRDRGLLEHALTHRSRVHEDASGGVFDNESMEFLGDAVLGFVIADMLFREFPQHNEGQKSKLKASLVSAAALARLGERIGLGEYLILGRGEEKTGGRRKQAIIADGYEALIAAIYLDGGIERRASSSSVSSRR